MLARLKTTLNPFRNVPYYNRDPESNEYSLAGNSPYSKIMHRSWKKQFKATFKAFNGSMPTILKPSQLLQGALFEDDSTIKELSLIDYLTGSTFLFLAHATRWAFMLLVASFMWSFTTYYPGGSRKQDIVDDIHRLIDNANPFLKISTKILLGIFSFLIMPIALTFTGLHMLGNGIIRPAFSALATGIVALCVFAATGIANLVLDRKAINRVAEIKSVTERVPFFNNENTLDSLSANLLKNGVACREPATCNQNSKVFIKYTFLPNTSPNQDESSIKNFTKDEVKNGKGIRFYVPVTENQLIKSIDALNKNAYKQAYKIK